MKSLSFTPVLNLALHECYFSGHNVVELTGTVWIIRPKVLAVAAVATLAITYIFCRYVSGFLSNTNDMPYILPEIGKEGIIAVKALLAVIVLCPNCWVPEL